MKNQRYLNVYRRSVSSGQDHRSVQGADNPSE